MLGKSNSLTFPSFPWLESHSFSSLPENPADNFRYKESHIHKTLILALYLRIVSTRICGYSWLTLQVGPEASWRGWHIMFTCPWYHFTKWSRNASAIELRPFQRVPRQCWGQNVLWSLKKMLSTTTSNNTPWKWHNLPLFRTKPTFRHQPPLPRGPRLKCACAMLSCLQLNFRRVPPTAWKINRILLISSCSRVCWARTACWNCVAALQEGSSNHVVRVEAFQGLVIPGIIKLHCEYNITSTFLLWTVSSHPSLLVLKIARRNS